jgi:DNA-binding CsgD family transcriptional regulator
MRRSDGAWISSISGEQRIGSPDRGDVPAVASFARSLVPMVIADDQRRYVAANAAACLLLRLPEEEIVRLRVDDLTPPESRALVGSLWEAFIREGTQHGVYELFAPDGARVRVEYSATANIAPGQHLSILMFPPGRSKHQPGEGSAAVLTGREREVLRLVAMGRSSGEIADALVVARSTVESHVRHCLDKLGARNRAHAIALALERGEITLELKTRALRRSRGAEGAR